MVLIFSSENMIENYLTVTCAVVMANVIAISTWTLVTALRIGASVITSSIVHSTLIDICNMKQM